MASFLKFTPHNVQDLAQDLNGKLRKCESLQEASQIYVRELYDMFESSLALVRFYLTVPYHKLLPQDQAFAKTIAENNQAGDQLQDDTIILSLLGSYGSDPAWRDRYKSKNHLAIPLISSSFVKSTPMIARLMDDMDLGLDWLDTRDTEIVVKRLGRLARIFYVPDASTFVDQESRLVVPAQDFVGAHHIKTVFGLGGGYVKGPFGSVIFFTKEDVNKPHAELFLPLMTTFKLATTDYVIRNNIYPS